MSESSCREIDETIRVYKEVEKREGQRCPTPGKNAQNKEQVPRREKVPVSKALLCRLNNDVVVTS